MTKKKQSKPVKSSKVVHINFDVGDHDLLKEKSSEIDMPIATYVKMLVLQAVKGATPTAYTPMEGALPTDNFGRAVIRPPRKISNKRS